ncbi:unnamed protein product [Linum tenue]|uniref:GH16 domain-containing protein n=1 Tax=Linum tenue TaxID=586396 RepID=A0AAV0QMM0_9ROSI|nr:unnamed protein product [Linum tenue]
MVLLYPEGLSIFIIKRVYLWFDPTISISMSTGGKGDREQRIYLWFDPTKDYHSYSVLWNNYLIAFFVDDVPIRVFKNLKNLGVKFPFEQPMKIYSSLWNADDWATRGGLEKTDWSKAPFIAAYRGFHVDGCEASVQAKFCATQGCEASVLLYPEGLSIFIIKFPPPPPPPQLTAASNWNLRVGIIFGDGQERKRAAPMRNRESEQEEKSLNFPTKGSYWDR